MRTIGHRGVILAEGCTPYQNTIAAFKQALRTMDGFETDAVASKDGTVYLIHHTKSVHAHVSNALDEHLNAASRPLTQGKRFEELSDEIISTLRLQSGEKIPTLRQALELFKGQKDKILNLELKGDHVYKHALPLLKEAINEGIIPEENIVISSFNHKDMQAIRKMLKTVKIGLIFMGADEKEHLMYPQTDNKESIYKPLTAHHLQSPEVIGLKPNYIIIPHTGATDEAFAHIQKHQPQAQVIVWVYTERLDAKGESFKHMITKHQQQLYAIIIDKP